MLFMASTMIICERNGVSPGHTTENIKNMNWKALDDTTTPYSLYTSAIGLGTNSYVKYDYLKFSGSFTSIGNAKVTHISGNLPKGVVLMGSASVTDAGKLQYSTPTRLINNTLTPNNISSLNSAINLIIGPQLDNTDPAYSSTKLNQADNTTGTLYSNYFLTQMQVASNASIGDTGPISMQISWDES